MRDALTRNADGHDAQLARWREFARAVGWDGADVTEPAQETAACEELWAGDDGRPLALDLVTIHVADSVLRAISAAQLDGLVERYGCAADPGTAYFTVHARLDAEHAARVGSALQGMLAAEDCFGLLSQAKAVHRSYWHMLDGLERAVAR